MTEINPLLLLVIGLLLVFLEFFLPGLILGALGSILIVASVVLFGIQANSPLELLFYFLGVGAAVAAVVYYAIKRIRRTAKAGTMYLDSDQAGYVASTFDATAIGKRGVALSDLKPSGHALIDGKQYQVSSQSGYVTQGTEIVVLGGQGAILFIKPVGS